MKYLLIFFILVSVNCFGQPITDTTGKVKLGGTGMVNTTIATKKDSATTGALLLSIGDRNGMSIADLPDSVRRFLSGSRSTSQPAVGIGNRIDFFIESDAPKYDTVKVIMLVCDTLSRIDTVGFEFNKEGFITTPITTKITPHHFCLWKFGYEVTYKGFYLEGDYPKYLDQYKKPLPKSLVVWATKEIK